MDKAEHASRLKQAMAAKGISNAALADAVGVGIRSVTNWRTAYSLPLPAERETLRRLFPGYDEAGDPVELAIRQSRLTEDRQYVVLGTYKRELRLQDEEKGATA